MVEYTGLSEFICGNPDWIYPNPMLNPYCPFDSYNLAYDLGYKLWEIIGGTLAWLINFIWPGNPISTWLIDEPTTVLFALLLFMLLIFMVAFVSVLIVLWEERKIWGRMMDRRGTMVGLKGFLQCVADGLKTFMKENTTPKKVDKMTYMWTVSLIMGLSALVACMVPLSYRWYVVNYDSGLLIIMAFFALAPFFILVSGWSQNNKYSLIGGMRAAELMISYEVPMLIIIASSVLLAGSFNIGDIVYAQNSSVWYLIPEILGAIVFFFCAIAEAERAPFDIAEAEAELVEGWQTEYAGMKWGLIMLGDYLRGTVSCGMVVILFLGGWTLPWIGDFSQFTIEGSTGIGYILAWLPMPEIVFLLKAYLVFFFMIVVRNSLARTRPDQILNIGWKVFMPLAVINFAIVLLLKLGGVM
ncbi:MAG: NADH-quinone oxidoreductase subunit H [Candidatus Methanomethylophilaceae archaeon]|nr:NADH-quinone oxidoreductase subunit H [Candidatus Methanomethylophilaceae archaeon]